MTFHIWVNACTTEFLSELLVQSIKEVSADIPICLIRRVFRRDQRRDDRYSHDDHQSLSSNFAGLHLTPGDSFSDHVPTHWVADSGATSHMTSNTGLLQHPALQQPAPFTGNDQVYMGNGNSLSIKGVGNWILPTPASPLLLNDILYVPALKENLLSIAKQATAERASAKAVALTNKQRIEL
jgi:hypothetical protein